MTNLEQKQAIAKEEAWTRVRGLLLQAVGHLYTVNEGSTEQAQLLDKADKAKIQAALWKVK